MAKDTRRDWHPNGDVEQNYLDSFSNQKLDPGDPAAFTARMVAFCRANKTVAEALLAGNIQLLGFEHVRESFGEHWPKVKAKVHLLTESVIKKEITGDDVYVLANDEQFIVLFGRATKDVAAAKSKRIAKEVNRRLNGFSDGSEGVTVRPMVLEIPQGEPETLATVDAMNKTVEEAQREREAADCQVFEQVKDEMHLIFWPVANIRKGLISMYQAAVEVPDGAMPDVESESGALEAAIDTFAITRASTALVDAAGRKQRAFLIVPVTYETLSVKRFRDAYIDQCRVLPQLAERRLILMVRAIPDDAPQSRLHGVFNYVAPFVAGFVGCFSINFDRTDKLGGISMIGVAADGASMEAMSAENFNAIREFALKNGINRARTFFTDTPNFDVATAARRAQFDYVQGVGVAPAMHRFGAVFSIS